MALYIYICREPRYKALYIHMASYVQGLYIYIYTALFTSPIYRALSNIGPYI